MEYELIVFKEPAKLNIHLDLYRLKFVDRDVFKKELTEMGIEFTSPLSWSVYISEVDFNLLRLTNKNWIIKDYFLMNKPVDNHFELFYIDKKNW